MQRITWRKCKIYVSTIFTERISVKWSKVSRRFPHLRVLPVNVEMRFAVHFDVFRIDIATQYYHCLYKSIHGAKSNYFWKIVYMSLLKSFAFFILTTTPLKVAYHCKHRVSSDNKLQHKFSVISPPAYDPTQPSSFAAKHHPLITPPRYKKTTVHFQDNLCLPTKKH